MFRGSILNYYRWNRLCCHFFCIGSNRKLTFHFVCRCTRCVVSHNYSVWFLCKTAALTRNTLWRHVVVIQRTMAGITVPGRTVLQVKKLLFYRKPCCTMAPVCPQMRKASTLSYQPELSPAEFGIYLCTAPGSNRYRSLAYAARTVDGVVLV